MKQPKRYLTVAHMAELCDVDAKAIHNWVNGDKLPSFRTPGSHLRFKPDDVVDFLEKYGYPVPAWVKELAGRTEGAVPALAVAQPEPRRRRIDNRHARVGVAVLVRRGDGALLMGLRKGAHGAGTWAPPGGALEVGEEAVDAAARELLEEAGIAVHLKQVQDLGIYTITHFEDCGGYTWVTLWCAVDLPGLPAAEVCEPEKCEEWRWFPRGARELGAAGDGRCFAPFDTFNRTWDPWLKGRPS